MTRTNMIITGAGGFLNSRLAKSCSNAFNITALDRKQLDLTDFPRVREVFRDLKPDIIIHGAAMSATQDCEDNPGLAHRINVESTVNIGRIARELGARMIFYSTEQVFNGNENDGPYGEEDEAIPNTIYGRTKLQAEELLREELEELWILRLSWIFGLPERNVPNGAGLVWKAIGAAMTNSAIKVSTNEYRGVTYAYDLIDNLTNILELPYGTYHFGSINELSTYETAVFILQAMGLARERIDRIVLRDDLKHRDRKRDLRLSYDKIQSHGIAIKTSEQSILNGLREFGFRFD